MALNPKQYILDLMQALNEPLKAWGWIAVTILLVFCGGVVLSEYPVPTWLSKISQLTLVGASTALFTRFLGGMGMFRDAIADVLGEDRWLDRRNDLEDLWRRITRRIFLIGFQEDAPNSKQFLDELNISMTKAIHKPEQRLNYYVKNAVRRINVSWGDKDKRMVRISDRMDCEIIPFNSGDECRYEFTFTSTTEETMDTYGVKLSKLFLDGIKKTEEDLTLIKDRNRERRFLTMKGKNSYSLSRTTECIQSIDADPIFVFDSGRVIWGMNVIININASGMRVNFEEIGLEGEFKLKHEDATKGEMERDIRGVLLPNQGFVIVMTTNARGVEA
jgi:hypothetical protein